MDYLLDVNVLVAWGWTDHTDHLRTAAWLGAMKRKPDVTLLTSAIPELGFIRVSVQRAGGRLPVAEAAATLSGMLESLGKQYAFLPDDQASTHAWPAWCGSASGTTDAHLANLAESHGIQLATLDEGIPGAFLVPARSD